MGADRGVGPRRFSRSASATIGADRRCRGGRSVVGSRGVNALHSNICARCNVKQRLFFNDKVCLMCKAQLDRVIYTTEPRRSYDTFDQAQLQLDEACGGTCSPML